MIDIDKDNRNRPITRPTDNQANPVAIRASSVVLSDGRNLEDVIAGWFDESPPPPPTQTTTLSGIIARRLIGSAITIDGFLWLVGGSIMDSGPILEIGSTQALRTQRGHLPVITAMSPLSEPSHHSAQSAIRHGRNGMRHANGVAIRCIEQYDDNGVQTIFPVTTHDVIGGHSHMPSAKLGGGWGDVHLMNVTLSGGTDAVRQSLDGVFTIGARIHERLTSINRGIASTNTAGVSDPDRMTSLHDANAIFVFGGDPTGGGSVAISNQATRMTYQNVVSTLPNMLSPRMRHAAVTHPDFSVFVAGGLSGWNPIVQALSVDRYSPAGVVSAMPQLTGITQASVTDSGLDCASDIVEFSGASLGMSLQNAPNVYIASQRVVQSYNQHGVNSIRLNLSNVSAGNMEGPNWVAAMGHYGGTAILTRNSNEDLVMVSHQFNAMHD